MYSSIGKKLFIIFIGLAIIVYGVIGIKNPDESIKRSHYPIFSSYVEENFFNENQDLQNQELLSDKYDLINDDWYIDDNGQMINYYVMEDSIDSSTFYVLQIESDFGTIESSVIYDELDTEYQLILDTKEDAELTYLVNGNYYYVITLGSMIFIFGLLWNGNTLSNTSSSKSGTLLPKFLDMRWFTRKK